MAVYCELLSLLKKRFILFSEDLSIPCEEQSNVLVSSPFLFFPVDCRLDVDNSSRFQLKKNQLFGPKCITRLRMFSK